MQRAGTFRQRFRDPALLADTLCEESVSLMFFYDLACLLPGENAERKLLRGVAHPDHRIQASSTVLFSSQ